VVLEGGNPPELNQVRPAGSDSRPIGALIQSRGTFVAPNAGLVNLVERFSGLRPPKRGVFGPLGASNVPQDCLTTCYPLQTFHKMTETRLLPNRCTSCRWAVSRTTRTSSGRRLVADTGWLAILICTGLYRCNVSTNLETVEPAFAADRSFNPTTRHHLLSRNGLRVSA
jgi:hypothetical protein